MDNKEEKPKTEKKGKYVVKEMCIRDRNNGSIALLKAVTAFVQG